MSLMTRLTPTVASAKAVVAMAISVVSMPSKGVLSSCERIGGYYIED